MGEGGGVNACLSKPRTDNLQCDRLSLAQWDTDMTHYRELAAPAKTAVFSSECFPQGCTILD